MTTDRKFVAGFQTSLDGYIAGPNGEQDWVRNWSAALNLIENVDLFIIGVGMYPSYGDYWQSIHEDNSPWAPFQDGPPDDAEIAYANRAATTRHVVLSTTAESVGWPKAEIVRSIEELRAIKAEQGGDAYVVGGATTVASLLDADLIDEIVLFVHPLILGRGRSVFGDVKHRHTMTLIGANPFPTGHAVLRYKVPAAPPDNARS